MTSFYTDSSLSSAFSIGIGYSGLIMIIFSLAVMGGVHLLQELSKFDFNPVKFNINYILFIFRINVNKF